MEKYHSFWIASRGESYVGTIDYIDLNKYKRLETCTNHYLLAGENIIILVCDFPIPTGTLNPCVKYASKNMFIYCFPKADGKGSTDQAPPGYRLHFWNNLYAYLPLGAKSKIRELLPILI